MNIEETSKLLGLIQVIDNRRVDEATILAWAPLVADVEYGVAVEAVNLHWRESTAYLLPAHVRANVARILGAEEHPQDEWGNYLEPDRAALAALGRVAPQRRAIGGAR